MTLPSSRRTRRRVPFAVLATCATLFGAVGALAMNDDAPVDLHTVDRTARSAASAAPEAVIPDDPDLERRLAEDVVAFVNSERQARHLPLLTMIDDHHARAANEVRLRDEEPGESVLKGYDAESSTEVFARLGTGTRTGEAVAGWIASDDGTALLDPDASAIAVAAACQPSDRGGDLVLTVHLLSGHTSTTGTDVPAVADERPGAGRGEACQFADLATGTTPADEQALAPAALAAAGTLAIALALLELQRRRMRSDIPGYVRVDQDAPTDPPVEPPA